MHRYLLSGSTEHQLCNMLVTYMQQGRLVVIAADPGQEHGYLVKMADDTIIPPYQLRPGQNVTLVSRYDSSVDHFGGLAHSACQGIFSQSLSSQSA